MLQTAATSCCGLDEINGFYGTVRDVGKQLTAAINATRRGALFVTLAGTQRATYEKLVLKRGFKRVAQFNNPNTTRDIAMYVKVVHKAQGIKNYDEGV